MTVSSFFCPGGADSQTGVAVKERYVDCEIHSCGKIPDVPALLDKNEGPFVVPIWNSHQGEVSAAEYVWEHLQQEKIKITDIWSKEIEFWFVTRVKEESPQRKVGSVFVAATQCSGFLAEQDATLIRRPLTTLAFDEYKAGAEWDGVLVAPGQGEDDSLYKVSSKKTANPNNFTSFVQLVPSRAFNTAHPSLNSWVTGVRMPAFSQTLGDTEQSVFENLLATVEAIDDAPRLVFVLKRTENVGLIFEGPQLSVGDLLDVEEQETGDVVVYEEAGATIKLYSEELFALLSRQFPALISSDFILHRGVDTCLFACPPLGIYTHGYKEETVEPVFRFYISRLFHLWVNEVACTSEQNEFFERHKDSWREKRSEFIDFQVIEATSTEAP